MSEGKRWHHASAAAKYVSTLIQYSTINDGNVDDEGHMRAIHANNANTKKYLFERFQQDAKKKLAEKKSNKGKMSKYNCCNCFL